jgi:ABC-2 type transport system ATP-binding protein
MISATDLHKSFRSMYAVRGISLEVGPGQVLALLGPNGAGKSTTVRLLATILRPSRGRAVVAGYDVVEAPEQVRRHVGLMTEYPALYSRMAASDYLLFFARLQGLSRSDATVRVQELLQRFNLWEARKRKLDTYSRGMKQKIALIRSMLHDPRVLFLDEPTTAMDPQSAHVVRESIMCLRDERRAILLCTHNLQEAEALADQIAVVRQGKIVAYGTAAELTHQLLGDPIWELHTAMPLNGVVEELHALTPLERCAPDRVRYRAADARAINPVLLERVHAAGISVISLSEIPRSLETVYLRIVGEPESGLAWPRPGAEHPIPRKGGL